MQKYFFTIFIALSVLLIGVSCNDSTVENGNRGSGGTVSLYDDLNYQPQIQTQAGQQIALVIGNDSYKDAPLTNPVNDARDMAKQLKTMGFNVTLKTNSTLSQMLKAIRTFEKRLLKSKNATALFYYAGHGMQVEGTNYLEPINSNVEDEDEVIQYTVPVSMVLKKMQNAETRLNILILDACRNNPFRGRSRNRNKGLAEIQNSSGSIISFATAPGKTADDDSQTGKNGLYTSHLLKGLKKAHQKHQRIDDMFMEVNAAVKRESGGEQVPWYNAALNQPVCFGGCKDKYSEQQAKIERLEKQLAEEKRNKREAREQTEKERQARIAAEKAKEAALSAVVQQPKPQPKLTKVFRDTLRDGTKGPEMVRIPAGSFNMGSKNGDSDEKPVHQVSVSAFSIGKYEVTFAEYDKFANATGKKKPKDRGWGRGNRPVIYVSWNDANDYANWLSKQTGKEYRLPTEAEWEYAARAGTTTKYWWGNKIGSNNANCRNSSCGDSFKHTAPVGSFAANPFGLHDTVGNVWEWCSDTYSSDYYSHSPRSNPTGPGGGETGRFRVPRGGAWYGPARIARTANRLYDSPGDRSSGLGFRLLRQP